MSPRLIFGGGCVGGTEKSFTYEWNTPEKVADLLAALKRLGIHEIDSAASYPLGNPGDTERLLGLACSNHAKACDFLVDSKTAYHHIGEANLSEERIVRSLERTLKLLNVDKVRTFYAHEPDGLTPIEVTAAAFDRQFRLGKFEKVGLCNFNAEQVAEYFSVCQRHGYVKPSVVQNHYNALHREDEEMLIPLLRQQNCAYIAYSPLYGGFLTGKVTLARDTGDESQLERTRWRGPSAIPPCEAAFERKDMHEAMRLLNKGCGAVTPPMTPVEATLRWLMHHSVLRAGDGFILGATKLRQLQANVRMTELGPLPDSLVMTFEKMWDIMKAST